MRLSDCVELSTTAEVTRLAGLLVERLSSGSWVVVIKALYSA
jgi:hypothetical protein